MRPIIITSIFLLAAAMLNAQQKSNIDTITKPKPSETPDPYRIDYKDVFDNMHYDQPLRPQVHYTPITGQIADATGLLRYKGKFHLFYMFDEWSRQRRDNKNWGHATSDDCIYWEQQPHITNSVIDNRPGSGSGIVDWNNTLGLRTGVEKTLVVFYTDYGRGVSIAFSNDAGKTWIRHKKNPVMPGKEGTRDPNVFWYKPDQSWRMVIYEQPGFSFYKSTNLTDWQFLSKMDGFFECPDFMEMAVDGNPEKKKWVLIDGNGASYIGEFDGTRFVPQSKKQALGQETLLNNSGGRPNYYTRDFYASQAWKQSYEGDGPFIQLAFMMVRGAPSHGRTWSQQMTFPVELSLKTINNEIRLCRNPIDGIKQLRYDPKFWKNADLKPGQNILSDIKGDVFEIIAEIDLQKSKEIIFDIRGEKMVYTTADRQLLFMGDKTTAVPKNNILKLRFIIDRNSVEVYTNEGETSITRLFYPDASNKNIGLTAAGEAKIQLMELYRLESIWLKREQELGYQRETLQK
jgi:fructan beta-fructosidase